MWNDVLIKDVDADASRTGVRGVRFSFHSRSSSEPGLLLRLSRRSNVVLQQQKSVVEPSGERGASEKALWHEAREQDAGAALLSVATGAVTSQVPPVSDLLTWHEAEPFQRFPHLMTGYRRAGTSHRECIASMFSTTLHNETINAWSMVAAMVAGAVLMVRSLAQAQPSNTWDASPFWVLFLSQLVHFPASVGYHTFMPVSAATMHRWRRVDLSLVLLLNAGSTYSLTYFTLGWYATLAVTAFACLCAATGMSSILRLQRGQSLDRRKMLCRVAGTAAGYYAVVLYRGYAALQAHRTALLGTPPHPQSAPAPASSPGATSVLSLDSLGLGGWCLPGPLAWLRCPEFATAVALVLCHGVGASCYAMHWPQRQFPKTFDRLGFSHNIMHVTCFAIYVWGYCYLAILHSKKDEWFGP